ncbi:ATP-binding protein [Vulcanisaeta thermophila]|uniref:ATP-binding protein n=1 Tax=Vulcanisaeta thermophila TaxID=867917 RepID=UPI00085349B5|nr:ATP-binding protein [Vulcanisaeta thermophila]
MAMVKLVGLTVSGFKGLSNVSISIPGNTLITGPSGSGKTSLTEALALLMQSRGEEWLVLEGNYLIIHEPQDILTGLRQDATVTIGVEFEVDDDGVRLGESVGTKLMMGSRVGYTYSFRFSDYWVRQWVSLNGNVIAVAEKVGSEGYLVSPVRAKLCLSPTHVMHEDAYLVCEGQDVPGARALVFVLRNMVKDKFYYLTEGRTCLWKRDYEVTVDLPRNSVGTDGQYTVHQLSIIQTRPEYEGIYNKVMELARELGIEDVKAGFTSPKRVSGYIKIRGHWLPMYHAGLKYRALLPILTQLVLTPRDSILVIDSADLGLTEDELEVLLKIISRVSSEVGFQVIMTSKRMVKVPGINTVQLSS